MKTNKKLAKHLSVMFFALLMPLQASAKDFIVNGICYNITSSADHTVEVTFKGNFYYSYDDKYSGTVTIPATVTYGGVMYSVTSIGDNAFYHCGSLTSITIPEGVTSIGDDAFRGCTSLTAIVVAEENEVYDSRGDCNAIIETASNVLIVGCSTTIIPKSVASIGDYAFSGCTSLTAITIPEGVTSIGRSAFYNCSSLTSITIPEGVTSIGNSAFSDCRSLTAITLPEGVTGIGDNAFYHCGSLTSITIPEGVTSIGDYAFSYCSGLMAITIPESVTSIGFDAFGKCDMLSAVHISNIENWCNIHFESYLSNPLYYAENLYLNGELVSEIVMPTAIREVKNFIFCGCGSLTSITIPEGVTSIGTNAFVNCKSLTSITIPESVTNIGSAAFSGCKSLTSITVVEGNTIYDSREGCNAIIITSMNSLQVGCTTTTFPESVTSIGSSAFSGSNLKSFVIPKSVTQISQNAFSGCTGDIIVNCDLPSVENERYGRFYNSDFHKVVIGDSVTSIGKNAFAACKSIKTLVFSSNLRKIATGAFSSSTAIEEVTIYATQPPRIDGEGNAIFSDATYENATLYVPQGCATKYQVMTGWSGFYNISEMEGGTPNYLTIRQADNGAVGIAVDMGRTYKVCITPSAGWKIHSVTFNGTDITTQLNDDNTLTTPTISGGSELVVAYEQVNTAIENARASRIKVQGHQGTLRITGATEGAAISVYTTDGVLVTQERAEASETEVTLPTGQVYIVKVADKVVKIGM